jgi:hypothetical protein
MTPRENYEPSAAAGGETTTNFWSCRRRASHLLSRPSAATVHNRVRSLLPRETGGSQRVSVPFVIVCDQKRSPDKALEGQRPCGNTVPDPV